MPVPGFVRISDCHSDRPVGAVIARLPTMPAPDVHGDFITSTVNKIAEN